MSSIRLLKDQGDKKKGEVHSFPFGVGRELVEKGLGEYLTGPVPQKPLLGAPASGEQHAAEIQRLNAFHAEALQHVENEARTAHRKQQKDHELEVTRLQTELDQAHRTIAELQAKLGGKK